MLRAPTSDETEALLKERAERFRHDATSASVDGTAMVVVRAGRDLYALEAARVVAVGELSRVTPIPHAPTHVFGFASLRGEVLVVFHLHGVLGVPPSPSEHGRIVVLGDGIALAVDAVERFTPIDLGALRPPPPALGAAAAALVRGVDADGVATLDIDEMMRSERLVVDVARARTGEKRSR